MPRPMTADLLRHIIEEDFQADVDKVVIHDIRESAFIATLVIKQNGHIIERDSRPSDALALAVRTKAPIYLSQKIVDKTLKEQDNARAMLDFLEAEVEDNEEIIKF